MKNTFKIEGMGCQHCAQKIEKALLNTNGVNEASIDFNTATLTVNYNEAQITPQAMADVVKEVGYTLVQ